MKTIYFVHDQQESPAARQNLLEMAGYKVELFHNSRDLFVAMKDSAPNLVLLDVLIEGQNGFETSKEIHSKTPDRTFPIIITSRIYRARQFRDEALRCGAQDYLLLPMKPEDFLNRLSRSMSEFHPGGEEVGGESAAA